jgi:CRP/FNR family cyclic AMP-dependent transcriptional regulator
VRAASARIVDMEIEPFSRSSLLGRLPQGDLRELAGHAVKRAYRAGHELFRRGDESDGLYAIVSGTVRVHIETVEGGAVEVAVRGPGETLGELAALDGMPRSASATAQSDVTVLWVPADRFRAWLVRHPHASAGMLEQLAKRLREATDQVGELALLSIETRIARRLWRMLGGDGEAPAAGAGAEVNQSELASALGVTRESVNKHLGRMKGAGIIEIAGGRVTLVLPDALRALTEDEL